MVSNTSAAKLLRRCVLRLSSLSAWDSIMLLPQAAKGVDETAVEDALLMVLRSCNDHSAGTKHVKR